jgi:tetratricopeptide (TPR) repeat protein
MNARIVYFVIGAVLVTVVAIFIFIPEAEEPQPAQSATGEMPPGHPDVGDEGMPGGVGAVRGEFMQEYNRLKEKVEKQDAADTSDVLAYARILLSAHQAGESVKYFERYLKKAPRDVTLMLDLSVAYFESKQPDKAEEITRRILAIEPGNTTAMYNLGALYAEQKRNDEAKAAWQKLIDTHPDSPDAERAKQFLGQLGKPQ